MDCSGTFLLPYLNFSEKVLKADVMIERLDAPC